MTSAEKIEGIRKRLKLTTNRLAVESGMEPNTLRAILYRNNGIKLSYAARIARTLKVDLNELVDDKDLAGG